jgi:hypothetical protein
LICTETPAKTCLKFSVVLILSPISSVCGFIWRGLFWHVQRDHLTGCRTSRLYVHFCQWTSTQSVLSVDFVRKCSISGLCHNMFCQCILSQRVLSVDFVTTCSSVDFVTTCSVSGLWRNVLCQWTLTQHVLSVDFDISSDIHCTSCPMSRQTAPSETVSLYMSKETYPFMDVLSVNLMSDDM